MAMRYISRSFVHVCLLLLQLHCFIFYFLQTTLYCSLLSFTLHSRPFAFILALQYLSLWPIGCVTFINVFCSFTFRQQCLFSFLYSSVTSILFFIHYHCFRLIENVPEVLWEQFYPFSFHYQVTVSSSLLSSDDCNPYAFTRLPFFTIHSDPYSLGRLSSHRYFAFSTSPFLRLLFPLGTWTFQDQRVFMSLWSRAVHLLLYPKDVEGKNFIQTSVGVFGSSCEKFYKSFSLLLKRRVSRNKKHAM